MEEQLINFETAKLAREKEFDIITKWWYDNSGIPNCVEYPNEEFILDYIIGDINYQSNTINIKSAHYLAPTQALLAKWLREVHKIWVFVNVSIFTLKHSYEVFKYNNDNSEPLIITDKDNSDEWNLSYEQALEFGLQEALKLINNESKTS